MSILSDKLPGAAGAARAADPLSQRNLPQDLQDRAGTSRWGFRRTRARAQDRTISGEWSAFGFGRRYGAYPVGRAGGAADGCRDGLETRFGGVALGLGRAGRAHVPAATGGRRLVARPPHGTAET